MKRYTSHLLVMLLAGPLLAGCGASDPEAALDAPPAAEIHDDHAGEDHHADEAGAITLTPEQQSQAGITTASVRLQELAATVSVPGRIVPSETGQALTGAIVSGRLVRLLAAEGESVRRGEALAVVESPEVGNLQGELLHTRATVERTGLELRRQEQLQAEGLSAERLLEQAREEHRTAQADLAAFEAQLRALGAAPATSPDDVNGQVTVRSPIAGVVSRRVAVLGAYVNANETLYEIIAPGSVYADAEVPPEQAAGLRSGTGAVITGPGGTRFRGEVASVAPTLEAETRTARVRARVLNATAALRPETFVNVAFESQAGREVLVIPQTAVERTGGESFVYRALEEPNTYQRVPVELGEPSGDVIEVLEGISSEDRVVVDGVFYLRSHRQKGELSEHEH